jgi:hypothetical protein
MLTQELPHLINANQCKVLALLGCKILVVIAYAQSCEAKWTIPTQLKKFVSLVLNRMALTLWYQSDFLISWLHV